MPMRDFRYCAELYNKYIIKNNIDLFRRRLVKFPTPQYYVFYNGDEDKPEKEILKLSDAFNVPVKEGTFEWTAIVLNINYGHNKKLLNQCSILGDYGKLISKIRELKKNKTAEQIADELEEEITDIQKIYDVAEKFAPEYNVNKIFETMNPNI